MTVNQALDTFDFLTDVHAAGGCVRDTIIGREFDDIDLASRDHPSDVIAKCKDRGIKVVETGIDHGTVTAFVDGEEFEITTFRRDVSTDGRRATVAFADRIEDDLSRRDFTINAIAMNSDRKLVDPFDGVGDIDREIIRSVGNAEERFAEDLLRIIRAARFASRFDFKIAGETAFAMGMLSDRVLDAVSVERVVMEMEKAFKDPTASRFLEILFNLGILQELIPEFQDMDLLFQNPEYHPEGDVFSHILEVVDRAPADPKHRFHALLHDIGKSVANQDVDGESYLSFHRHDHEGAKLIPRVARDLKLSNDLRDSIQVVTELHMRPLHVENGDGEVSDSTIRRFQRDAGEYLEDLQILAEADHGRGGSPLFNELEDPVEPILMGRHLIDDGFQPGPHFGPALEAAFNIQIEDGVTDIDRLLDVARQELQ